MHARTRSLVLALPLALFSPRALAQTWETCGALHTWTGEAQGDRFGQSLRRTGDTDGDGLMDVLIGAPNHAGDTGRAYLYSGATGALLLTLDAPLPGHAFGFIVNPAGDVDADGADDLIIGAPDPTGASPGEAYVFSGASGALLYSFVGEQAGDMFGREADGLGDVNADGVPDFGIGARMHSSLGAERGRAYVFSGADGSPLYVFDGDATSDRLGAGIAGIGDRNGDGHADFLIGADQGLVSRGIAYVHDGASGARVCTLTPPPMGAVFGRSMLGAAGDLTGDGVPDFFIADFADAQLRGRARIYDGSDCSLLYQMRGDAAGDTFGTGSGLAGGDLDGDGVDDLIFGALGAGGEGRGILRLFSGADGSTIGTIHGSEAMRGFGFDASDAGDLNGDGGPDFIVSAPSHDTNRGIVYALSSRPLPPRPTCVGAPNSTGLASVMSYSNSLSLAANELNLHTTQAPPGQSGLFFYGGGPASIPLGNGTLCVSAPRYRIGPPVPIDASGQANLALDLTRLPFSAGGGAVMAGSTVHFQFWHRDAGGAGSNLSGGLELSFCP